MLKDREIISEVSLLISDIVLGINKKIDLLLHLRLYARAMSSLYL